MRINFNISSIVAKNALANNDTRLSESTLKLSSGYKINKASDNAAGLAISRKMNAQINSLMRANQNSNDGLSVVNTADGAMAEMHDILQRMNELAIQSANGTNSDDDRSQIQLEIDELIQELDRIADTTQFNAQNLLDGTYAYKGYTNTENVKVMSYTDGVTSGTYVIGKIQYYHCEDMVTTYTGAAKTDAQGNKTKEISSMESEDTYEISSADDIRNALVKGDTLADYEDISGVTAFPDGALVSIEDENVIIKSEGDFEIKLAINARNAVTGAGLAETVVTTITYSTYTYKGISVYVEPEADVEYSIGTLNVGGENGADVVDNANYQNIAANLRSYFEDENVNQKNVEITNMTCDTATGEMTITYNYTAADDTDVTDATLTLKLYQEPDATISNGTKNTMEDYLYQMRETTKTVYEVGDGSKDNCIALNITGMGAMQIQVGANNGQVLEIEIPDLNTIYLGVDDLNVGTEDKATAAIDIVGKAINYLSSVRAKIGAYANRLEHTITNLNTTEENMTAAYSRIMDVDMATEMTEYSTVQVLVQASTSMLAQANERPEQVLQLLQ